eukprot:s539_g24.t1
MSLQAPARVAVATTESDAAQSQQIQEIASEVLRLRLVQSQYKQLEGQLRTTSEKLRDLLPDKAPHFSQYLEQGLRPGGTVGTLGGFHGGAEPESLLGIMECLCVVCNAQVSSRREDLVAACQWLLQDPKCLAETLASLPAAPGALSRRLAPYLLTCDSSWRGSLNEAGQCYEAFRSWLSCYYQYSLVSAQMEASAAQLQLQEQLLKELNKEPSPGTDIPRSTQVKSAVWRHSSGLRRSSSVQSTSSAGSRRSPSPSDVKAARPGDAGGRKSAGGAISLTRVSREASQKSPLGRSEKSLKTARASDIFGLEILEADCKAVASSRCLSACALLLCRDHGELLRQISRARRTRNAEASRVHFKDELLTLGNTPTIFAAYLPDTTEFKKLPVVYWLSGLTCTDENFSQKAGAFQAACDNQVVLVMPDTSPRGDGVPDEELHDLQRDQQEPHAYDFGIGAGFYLNATTDKYKTHYNMYDFVVKELPAFVEANFPVSSKRAISGHSMGGHGALTIAMKNPERYTSVSAFAPICNPMNVPWGQKAFKLYLGEDQQGWKQYDATELISQYTGKDLHILCDCGTADSFLVGDVNQLQPLAFMAAAQQAKVPITFRT